ncbi:MAG: universal stress protein [Candidatus Manganitrophaceae bacterium]|nr:MAG: universal stress protein [Candidatus Manganitrophaceae bacterium]
MQIMTILVPTDFSELSNEAVDYAFSMAKRVGAKMVFIHTLEWPDHPDEMTPMSDEGYAFMKDRSNALLHDLVEQAEKEGLEASAELADGVPFVEIIQAARKNKADLIVMGTHGRTGLSHLMMGSQAERVVRQSPCPVLTVKSPQHASPSA